jgi:hypothetical protein
MATIVEYTDEKPPVNTYPKHIVSPTEGSTCCPQKMEQIGGIEREGGRSYFYRRCRVCGFTVRHFLSGPLPQTSGRWEGEMTQLLKQIA